MVQSFRTSSGERELELEEKKDSLSRTRLKMWRRGTTGEGGEEEG